MVKDVSPLEGLIKMIDSYTKVDEYNTDFELRLRQRDEKVMKESNKHASEVDKLLSQYGLEWKLNPYRVVYAGTDVIAQEGPKFDLRRPVLAKLQNERPLSK